MYFEKKKHYVAIYPLVVISVNLRDVDWIENYWDVNKQHHKSRQLLEDVSWRSYQTINLCWML